VRVNGREQSADLSAAAPGEVVLRFNEFEAAANLNRALSLYFPLAAIALLFFVLTVLLVDWRGAPAHRPLRRGAWLAYALPMLAVWGVYFATFFPAGMSQDSFGQWQQVLSGHFDDWAPAFHTLLIWLASRLWRSPAAFIAVQILGFSLTVAWGIGGLRRYGLPGWAAWLVSAVFALLPANGVMAITLWKDIPYAISVLALTVATLQVVLSQGEWLRHKGHLALLWLVLLGVSMFRHNGLPLAAGVLVLLLIFFWRQRRAVLAVALLLAAGYGAIKGPLYDLLQVDRSSSTLGNTLLLHHIDAHVQAGTPLSEEERSYLNALYPLGGDEALAQGEDEASAQGWPYACCSVNAIYFDPGFNQELFARSGAETLHVFLDILWRNPMVNLQHMVCSSGMYWEIPQTRCYLYKFTLMIDLESNFVHWMNANDLGMAEDSQLPGMVLPLARVVDWSTREPLYPFAWRPAFYMLLAFYAAAVFAMRQGQALTLLVAAPAFLQTGIGAVINLAQDYRYQYSIVLVGLLFLALLCTPARQAEQS
jgi:hypothetical protein